MFSYRKREEQPSRHSTDYFSDESKNAPRVSVVIESVLDQPPRFVFQPFVAGGSWNIYFLNPPSENELKAAFARLNNARPDDIIIQKKGEK